MSFVSNSCKGGGERRMKKKMVLIPILVLLMLIIIVPVMAQPTNGQKVPASEVSATIPYVSSNPATSTLTKLCLAAGLSSNPYPAPPIRERSYNPGHVPNPSPAPTDFETMQVKDASSYYLITDLNIGGTHYTGVSCNVYTGEYNLHQQTMSMEYDAIWYVGALGDLRSGFAGNIEAKIFDYLIGGMYSRITVHLVMHGFGDFEGQTLMLSFDSATDPGGINGAWNGYCLKA
jgi:hypothetical protein